MFLNKNAAGGAGKSSRQTEISPSVLFPDFLLRPGRDDHCQPARRGKEVSGPDNIPCLTKRILPRMVDQRQVREGE